MRVGLDTFTIRELELDPFETLDWIADHELEGAQFGGVRGLSPDLDGGKLKEIFDHAASTGLYCRVSVSGCNPHQVDLPPEQHVERLGEEIAAAAAQGRHELHTSIGGGDERYMQTVPWTEQLADTARFIRRLAPVLRDHGSRIDIETHGDVTTFELIRMIEDVGPDILGICLDTANLLCQAEDPVSATRRAAPYTHLTHIKDGMIVFTDRGYRRQTLPPGRGMLDWRTMLPVLAEHSPNLPLSIEDHKWIFRFHVFEEQWLRLHPDLTREEFAKVMRFAYRCETKMRAGELPDPDAYEPIPYLDELEDRVGAGRKYLQELLGELSLRDRPDGDAERKSLSMFGPEWEK